MEYDSLTHPDSRSAGPLSPRPLPGRIHALCAVLALALAYETVASDPGILDEPAQLRWKHRVLFVSATEDTSDTIGLLRKNHDGIRERDVLWFLLADTSLETNYTGPVARSFSDAARDLLQDSRVVLVGKDGGVKLRSPDLDIATIFARIDAMPMRRREMQR